MLDVYTEIRKLTDAQLVEVSRQGDQAGFDELVRRHRQRCVDLAGSFLRNHGDAEDQVQIALTKAYEHLDQYQGDAEFSTWLARIVANQCLMLMRGRRRARFLYLDEVPDEPKTAPIQLSAPGSDPEGELAFQQLIQVLKQELNRIPRLLRNVMLLRDVQELPVVDVARQLGISVPAAKSRLVRARTELRSRMNRHYQGITHTSPLSRSAAPLDRVGRHHVRQVV
jgi:RNA polymerase sigma-70 factor (ECF subfamily)